jgi:hypothetical protein
VVDAAPEVALPLAAPAAPPEGLTAPVGLAVAGEVASVGVDVEVPALTSAPPLVLAPVPVPVSVPEFTAPLAVEPVVAVPAVLEPMPLVLAPALMSLDEVVAAVFASVPVEADPDHQSVEARLLGEAFK